MGPLSPRSLFRKYAVVFIILVGGALTTSGLVELYFSSQETQAALVGIQREQASGAAARIEAFLGQAERQIAGAVPEPGPGGPVPIGQRHLDYLRLLRQVPAITDLSYLDAAGREQDRLSRLALDVAGSQADLSREERFLAARGGRAYFGPVYFRDESEPYLTLSVGEPGPAGGVTVAELNLKFIWEVVSGIRVGQSGYAYVVDQRGQLVAHPDLNLVLQRADLSGLPQVSQALAPGSGASAGHSTLGQDRQGRPVVTAHQAIDPPGWTVLVDQPVEEAFAPLYALGLRTALLLLAGLGLSVLASLVLARRMVRPIRALEAAAVRIGAGALDQRIEVRTGDELETLGATFNQMSDRLRESYATLEQRVADRTRELATALEQLRALAAVSHAVNSTLDLPEVLATIVSRAVQLAGADGGAIYEFDDAAQEFRLQATHGISPGLVAVIRETRLRLGDTLGGEAGARPVALAVADLGQAHGYPLHETLALAGFRALLLLPLLRDDQIVGVLGVQRRQPGLFPAATVELLETFASHSALAIVNARLFAEVAQNRRQLEQRVQAQVAELERLGRLRRFLSPSLAELLVSVDGEALLESHRRQIGVACCRLGGFSALAEAAAPEEVIGVLRLYHAALGPIIFQFEGSVGPLVGDRLIIFFNDPLPCEDPARQAVQLAMAMRDRMRDLLVNWRREGHALAFKVGVDLGYATLGTVGLGGRTEYGAVGPVVQLASALCDAARDGQILLSPRVHLAVEEWVQTRSLGQLTLGEFTRPIPAVEVASIETGIDAPAKATGAHPEALTEREREVVELIARGCSNRQIAEELVIAESTAVRHVANIFNKLNCRSRAQVAAWAVEHLRTAPR